MAEYDNRNRGALFKADKKTDKHPDYDGTLDVEGKQFYLSAWIREAKSGAKFMSVAVKPKDAKPAAQPAAKAKINPDEDIPF